MESKDISFENFFHKKAYEIPDYQRPYEWKDVSHVHDFWHDIGLQAEDIEKSNNSGSYPDLFLGVIILEAKESRNKFEVVDGNKE